MPKPKIPGMFIGLKVTMTELLRTLFPHSGAKRLMPAPSTGAVTVQYPREKEDPAPGARGVIALHEGNCTACMLCARSCPDWCIYIEGHKEKAPPRRPGGKPRQVNALDRFDIDYSLCMYCGICVEVCPFEALFWTPEYEYSEPRIADLLHDKTRLGEWMETVPAFEAYEAGSEMKVKKVPRVSLLVAAEAAPYLQGTDDPINVSQTVAFGVIALMMVYGALRVVTTKNVVHAAMWLVLVLAGAAAQYILLAAEFVAVTQVMVYIGAVVVLFLFGVMLTRAKLGQDGDLTRRNWYGGAVVAVVLFGLLAFSLVDTFEDAKVPEERQLAYPTAETVSESDDGATVAVDGEVRMSNTQALSDSIFSRYLIQFEVISVLLTAALVGAIVIARRD